MDEEEARLNSLLYWYPKVSETLISPKTEWVLLTKEEIAQYWRGEGFDVTRVAERIEQIVKNHFKLPVFLRTDHFSAKHGWKNTCYVDDLSKLRGHIFEIVVRSRTAGVFGLPIKAIIIRQFIEMDTKFNAFMGEMPINPERRYFVKDGKVLCHHPYWIEEAVEQGTPQEMLPLAWITDLREVNTETEDEVRLLTAYAKKVAEKFEGYWSIDFCKTKKGHWCLIDMALGTHSWHPETCSVLMKHLEQGFFGNVVPILIPEKEEAA